ncbi:MAG TPA: primosomal protein N' [Vicinamibacterales bacterium]|nr:primosomal protein N' [Vicinamibacterales bacterium]
MFLAVAVPVPQLDLLTYRTPDGVDVPVGARVVVPIGKRSVTGIVVEASALPPDGVEASRIKPVTKVLDAEAFLPADVVALARWTAEYYAAGVGETITAVLPPKTRGDRADAHKKMRVAAITAQGLDVLSLGTLTEKQRAALEVLRGVPGGLATTQLAGRGVSADVVSRLVSSGLASIRRQSIDRDPFVAGTFDAPPADASRVLTAEQGAALQKLEALAGTGAFRVALLHGVTGSGKTEIYLRLSAFARTLGRSALMLVPEIALTPAVSGFFRREFGDRVAVQHSGLSDGERHDQWQRIRRGDVDIVVGTRSAVFSPIPRLGLIIVDEEHDTSYKQEESPRYNGRDVAIVRAQQAGALVVLGSATPSMESYQHATSGKYERVVLERRVLDRPLATVTVVDMRQEYADAGPDVVLSRALVDGIGARLDRGEQALVLLNRRGFATSVFCRQCGGTVDCPNCSVSLVVHGVGASRRARCHYCNHSARVPATCPSCAAPYMEQTGFGTERVEAEVKKAWPAARVARLDRDAVRRKGAAAALLSRLRDGEIDVLVGTQMIAKGHDFPKVTLVGVVSADVGLGMADFRASERTFQLLTQVAGRAGRGETPGEALVQTIYPDHYSIQLACGQHYQAFFEREQEFRRAMRYPPFLSIVNIVVRAKTFSAAMDDAAEIAGRIQERAKGLGVLGPAPAPLGRLRGEYRAQILIKGGNRTTMRETLVAALAARPDIARRTIVDVDPLSVL